MAISPQIRLLKSFLRIGFVQFAVPQKICLKKIRVFLSFLRGKCHLASVISQKTNDGSEDERQDKIDEMDPVEENAWVQTTPEEENDLKDEQKNRKLNLSFDIIGEFQSIIDPPGEEARGHCKGRTDRPQDKKVKTHGLVSGVFKKEIEQHKERRAHQEGDRKMDDHGVGMAPHHRKLLQERLKHGREVLQLLRYSFLQDSYLRVMLQDLWPMGSCRNFSAQVLASGMPFHVKAFGPERTLGDIIDLSMKGDIRRVSILAAKR